MGVATTTKSISPQIPDSSLLGLQTLMIAGFRYEESVPFLEKSTTKNWRCSVHSRGYEGGNCFILPLGSPLTFDLNDCLQIIIIANMHIFALAIATHLFVRAGLYPLPPPQTCAGLFYLTFRQLRQSMYVGCHRFGARSVKLNGIFHTGEFTDLELGLDACRLFMPSFIQPPSLHGHVCMPVHSGPRFL